MMRGQHKAVAPDSQACTQRSTQQERHVEAHCHAAANRHDRTASSETARARWLDVCIPLGMANKQRPLRYAVVGAGNIAQVAVLPAFAHAKENSKLVAIVSDDADKQ